MTNKFKIKYPLHDLEGTQVVRNYKCPNDGTDLRLVEGKIWACPDCGEIYSNEPYN